ncbi:MAG: hypothetical protein V4696_07580 [Pseudomonadota bacterium]
MPDQQSASENAIVSTERVRLVVQGILRAANLKWTDEVLSAASGVPARNIKSYRVEGKLPPLPVALSLAVVLGGDAINALLATIGYVARPLDEADEIQPAQIVANGLSAFTVIATAAADGRIDHLERLACREAADQIIATVMPLSSAGQAE